MAERTDQLKRDIEATRDHMGGTMEAIGDRVSPGRIAERRWNRVRQSTSRLSQSVMGSPRTSGGSAEGTVDGLRSSASDAASSAGEAITNAPDRLQEATQGNPLAVGAAAFAVGVLLGSLAPPSQEEQQLMEQVAEPLQHELVAAGQQVADAVREQAQEGVEQTKAAATAAAGEVKEHASDAADDVKGQAQTAKDQVQTDAKAAADDVRN
jgi:hypothetical protein